MIMRANELTFVVVAASPTIGVLSLGVLIIYLVKRSQQKGRLARRGLLRQIEWRLIELKRKNDHEIYWHGLLLYTLDQLYKATERPAKATHECKRDEITNLGDRSQLAIDEVGILLD
ncbi:protein DGS1, mitochondrial [Tanacetum coccineum]